MKTMINKLEKTNEQRIKENAEYLAMLKAKALKEKSKRDISHLIGSIGKDTAEKMLKHVDNERNNW